jgi:hypothetical protein
MPTYCTLHFMNVAGRPEECKLRSSDANTPLDSDFKPLLVRVTKLPEICEPEGSGDYATFTEEIWNKLKEHSPDVGIILSLSLLQDAGAAITNDISWERTVEDLAAELRLFPRLHALSQFGNLYVSVGGQGLVHIRRNRGHPSRSTRFDGTLLFPPHKQPTLEPADAIITKLIRNVLEPQRDKPDWWWLENYYAAKPEEKIVSVQIPEHVFGLPNEHLTHKRWRILTDTLEKAPVHRINIAVAIIKAGVDNVLNNSWSRDNLRTPERRHLWKILTRVEYWNPYDLAPDFVTLREHDRPAMPPRLTHSLPQIRGEHDSKEGFTLPVPIAKFQAITAAERDQIEELSSVKRLFQTYKDDQVAGRPRHEAPVSIAVFAPPGAGKSFAVEEIAKDLCYQDHERFEFNVAQFRKVGDLTRALDEIELYSRTSPKPPLAFFDEFDCALDGEPLGWLRYFLAPMQNGNFGSRVVAGKKIKRAIFVFAGGINASFEQFDPRARVSTEGLGYTISEEYRREVKQFADRKGPDFISRLRGHINIADANAEPGHSKHFIRRAIQLRGLLEKLRYAKADEFVDIDEALIYALLTVDRYRHGVRSMESVLRMCRPFGNTCLRIPSLPSLPQLDMHVDADEFWIRLYRGRSRMQPRLSAVLVEDLDQFIKGIKDLSEGDVKGYVLKRAEDLKNRLVAEDATEIRDELRVLQKLLPEKPSTPSSAAAV